MVNQISVYACTHECWNCPDKKDCREFRREIESFNISSNRQKSKQNIMNTNYSLEEFLKFIGRASVRFNVTVEKIEEIWKVTHKKAVDILNDMMKKGILFEPKPAVFKVL